MRQLVAITALVLACGSPGDGEPQTGPGQAGDAGLVHALILFEDIPPGRILPWSAPDLCPGVPVACGVLATDFSADAVPVVQILASRAADADRLMLLVDCRGTEGVSGRDNIEIRTDSAGSARTVPATVAADISGYDWGDPIGRQEAVMAVVEKYQPDVVLVTLPGLDEPGALEVCRAWIGQTRTGRLGVSFVNPPGKVSGRGWAVLAGPGVRSGVISGMTAMDFTATVTVLSGLDWEPALANGIPGLSVLSSVPPGLLGGAD